MSELDDRPETLEPTGLQAPEELGKAPDLPDDDASGGEPDPGESGWGSWAEGADSEGEPENPGDPDAGEEPGQEEAGEPEAEPEDPDAGKDEEADQDPEAAEQQLPDGEPESDDPGDPDAGEEQAKDVEGAETEEPSLKAEPSDDPGDLDAGEEVNEEPEPWPEEAEKLGAEVEAVPESDVEEPNAADIDARIASLKSEGHATDRHLDPDATKLQARLGTTVYNPDGTPRIKAAGPNIGHVASRDWIDPVTGTTSDADTGDPHHCGPYATRFNDPADMAKIDAYARDRIATSGTPPGGIPIADVLGPDGHTRMTGYYKDPSNPGSYLPVDFENGFVTAIYRQDPVTGTWKNRTMYPGPADGRHP